MDDPRLALQDTSSQVGTFNAADGTEGLPSQLPRMHVKDAALWTKATLLNKTRAAVEGRADDQQQHCNKLCGRVPSYVTSLIRLL